MRHTNRRINLTLLYGNMQRPSSAAAASTSSLAAREVDGTEMGSGEL
jgi:hypothetical protein